MRPRGIRIGKEFCEIGKAAIVESFRERIRLILGHDVFVWGRGVLESALRQGRQGSEQRNEQPGGVGSPAEFNVRLLVTEMCVD